MIEEAYQIRLAALERRLERERAARREAESLLESKALELFEVNQDLTRLAATDHLTGLVNRGAFASALAQRIDRVRESGEALALFVVDLDRFKAVNDAMGHGGGDRLLTGTAERLLRFAGPEDIVARLGGDEFAVVVTGNAAGFDVRSAADALCNILRPAHAVLGRQVDSTASVGVAIFPHDADNPVDLQRFADMALYKAKSQGRDRWAVFDDPLRLELARRELLAGELRRGIDGGEIVPWFQPIFDAASGRVTGLEVLARWVHPERGMIGPDVFVPLAEDMALIAQLDEQMFDTACRSAESWVEEGLIDYISVNVSPRALLATDFSAKLIARLRQTALPPEALVVEITETFLMKDMAAARRHIERLSAVGVKVALDDFGTGYSNLRALLQLPIDTIKIDQSLIADVGRDSRVSRLLRALFQTARVLGVMVVAEGVERADQALFLRGAGCTRLQGYLFARPAPAAETERLLRDQPEVVENPAPVSQLRGLASPFSDRIASARSG